MDTVLYKYQDKGAEYLVYDTCLNTEKLNAKTVRAICARNFALGARGILAGPLPKNRAGVTMYRPDGSQADAGDDGTAVFFSYLKDTGCRSRERSAGLPAHAVGKLFLTEEFMRKNRQ